MSVRVFYDILNQKGTPAMYTDTFANRPAYGYQGRLFISTDSGQIFEDTGSAWTLVADAGVGGGTLSSVCLNGNTTATGIVITAGGLSSNSITNTGITAGSVVYAGTGGLMSQSNSTFFWDSTNNRLGINNASPGAPLDIHGTGTQIQVNGTGSNNSYIQFQNAGVSKWRIGNTYNGAANTFDLYNNSLTSTALSFNVTTNAATFNNTITATSLIKSGGTSTQFLKADGSIDSNTYLTTSSASSTYLPLTGGTLSGNLLITSSPRTTTLSETGLVFQGIGGSVSFLNLFNNADAGNTLVRAGANSPYVSSILVTGNYTDPTNPNTDPGTIIFTTASTPRARINANGTFSIGNTNNTYNLDVTGTGRYTGLLTTSAGINLPVGQAINSNSGRIILNNGSIYIGDIDGVNPTGAVNMRQNGNTFISYNSSILSITGTVNISTLGTGTVTATGGTLSTVSDMNLKVEDGFIDNALIKVMNLKPRYFNRQKERCLPTDISQ